MPDQARGDAVGALRWGLRRYALLVVACVVLVVVLAPAYLTTRPTENLATALVVAQRLDMDLTALPRFGEALFDNGVVAQRVAAEFGDAGDYEDIIPARVTLVAEQDSIVFGVTGRDASPVTAAAIANLAAETFTNQLNAPGDGVGLFVLQSRAVPPTEPEEPLPPVTVMAPIALAAGLILGLAVVGTLLVVRRPVLNASGAVEATGVPVLGSVVLPRTRPNDYPGLPEMSGIVPVCRRLLAMNVRTVVLVGPSRSARGRRQLMVALSYVLSRVRRVHLVAETGIIAAAEVYGGHETRPSGFAYSPRPNPKPELTLMDDSQPLDPVQLTGDTLTVLVVPAGTSSANLRTAVTEYLGDGDAGRLLMLHERRSRRWRRDGTKKSREATAAGPDTEHEDVKARPAYVGRQ